MSLCQVDSHRSLAVTHEYSYGEKKILRMAPIFLLSLFIMKKLPLLCLSGLLLCLLTACGKTSPEHAERAKPRISISSEAVLLRRAPAANAQITADGVLRIDDIVLPQQEPNRAKLQLLFGHLQMLRQQALTEAKPDPEYRAITVKSTSDIDQLSNELLQTIPPLQPYRESFGNLQAERH